MTRKSLLLLYAAILFVMMWGLDLLIVMKLDTPLEMWDLVNLFTASMLIYAGSTLVLMRLVSIRYFRSKRYGWFALVTLLLLCYFIFMRYVLEQVIYPRAFGISNYPGTVKMKYYFLDNVYYAVIYLALGFMVYLIDNQIRQQKQQSALLIQTRDAELQFLRSQINPHFLFNTLNNIYSLVYEKSDSAPQAVLRLSDLMRYTLYEQKEKVALQKEWDYITNFAELERLRFDNDIQISLTATGDLHRETAPYLLIPFVENAFKHGDPRQPIQIELNSTKGRIHFTVSNKITRKQKDTSGGIGLCNVHRRLELLYPNKHSLTVQQNEHEYTAHLEIKTEA